MRKKKIDMTGHNHFPKLLGLAAIVGVGLVAIIKPIMKKAKVNKQTSKEEDYNYDDYEDENYNYDYEDEDEDEDYDDYEDDDPFKMPFCCQACGGPWPDCMTSCKIFDD